MSSIFVTRLKLTYAFISYRCPPCRAFTPNLVEVYNLAKSHGLEIIFVSSDNDTTSFNGYYSKMPWLALPFKSREIKNKLSSKMGIRGIPSLIILDAKTGNYISNNGRNEVMSVIGKSEEKVKDLIKSWEGKKSIPLDQLKSVKQGGGCQIQ